MGCEHINDYVRAILAVAWRYVGKVYNDECPWCANESIRAELAEARKKVEELERTLNHDRAALEMHQASIIDLPDKDLLAIGGRLIDRAEKAEQELAEARKQLSESVTPCQSIRIQEENHNAYLDMMTQRDAAIKAKGER